MPGAIKGEFALDSARIPGGVHHFAHIKLKSTGQKVAIPALCKKPNTNYAKPDVVLALEKASSAVSPPVLGFSVGFFHICKNGLFFVTYFPAPEGCHFFADMEKKPARN